MIGLSVSGCIADICRGKVGINDFEKIVSATKCVTEEDWDTVIEDYTKAYWSEFPEEAVKILRQLLAEGRIEQPRTVTGRWPLWGPDGERWLDSEKEIRWNTN